ncbi:hypothetical protein RhiirA4_411562 [Rhizophagus irregularis]|uniref:Uncharacterized protein n=1 Tax=Rhizophagus irregularis TaxID=588596 RepID=A0A2I1HE73_9GLOM|nr:hypothetical protein RhiirA4_411562 [Rhizophagus irregularis]
MNLDVQVLEWRKKLLQDASDTSFGWAGILFFVPGVNLIATPILIAKGVKKDEQLVAVKEEVDLVYRAVQVVELSLVPSIDEFINSLVKICGFFNDLANELSILAGNHQENARITHYKKIKAKADEIVKACRYYMCKIPDCETNLRAIPNKHDKNYVQEWLLRKRINTEIDNNDEVTLAYWGIKLFASDEKLINLIAN